MRRSRAQLSFAEVQGGERFVGLSGALVQMPPAHLRQRTLGFPQIRLQGWHARADKLVESPGIACHRVGRRRPSRHRAATASSLFSLPACFRSLCVVPLSSARLTMAASRPAMRSASWRSVAASRCERPSACWRASSASEVASSRMADSSATTAACRFSSPARCSAGSARDPGVRCVLAGPRQRVMATYGRLLASWLSAIWRIGRQHDVAG